MTNVHVWLPKYHGGELNVGHAGMQVQATYMSWWPDDSAGLTGSFYPQRNKSYSSDIADEGGPPDRSVQLNRLDEQAMLSWWGGFGLVVDGKLLEGPLPRYQLIAQNCSTVVATGLKHGGGDRRASWYSRHCAVWRPQSVLDYAMSIQQGLASAK